MHNHYLMLAFWLMLGFISVYSEDSKLLFALVNQYNGMQLREK